MKTYRTFKRSATNFEEFASAPKIEVDSGLSYEEARAACAEFNDNRTDDEIAKGTKLEFTAE